MNSLSIVLTRLRKLLHHRGKTSDEADDVIQEAFLRLQVYRQARPVREPEAFLVRTALNISTDVQRHRSRWNANVAVDSATHPLVDPKPTPEEILVGQQSVQRLHAGLDSLPPRTRDVLLLQRIEGCSHAQIAERLSITVSAVEKHVARGVLFLTQWMNQP